MSTLLDTTINPSDRLTADRRRKPTSFWSAFRLGGRRMGQRRADEQRQHYFVERFTNRACSLAILLLCLSMADAAATLLLLDAGCAEVNPAMSFLLGYGPQTFLLGKFLMTIIALPVLLIAQHCYLFRTRLRVSYFLPILISLYVVLLCYQISLCILI